MRDEGLSVRAGELIVLLLCVAVTLLVVAITSGPE